MANSGNATLTGSGNSTVKTSNSLRNSGNSTASATNGPVTVGPVTSTNANTSQGGSASNGPITMNDISNVEAPKIPVNTAASVFVNDCQNGLSMQTKKVGLSSASESYRCQLLDEANTEFSLAFKSWQQGAIHVDTYIQTLEARIDADREKVVEYEEALRADSMGKRVGGLSPERIELYKSNVAVLQARIDQWQQVIDVQFPFMLELTGEAQEHYQKGLDYVKQAGFTIKKHKVSGMVAEISNDLMAPFAVTLGVVSAAKQ